MNNIKNNTAIYIHIPWCIKKCPYCDFNSYAVKNNLPEELYAQKLILDLKNDLENTNINKISSIYFGGGTPSLFSAQTIEKIIQDTQKLVNFDNKIEITLEANPSTLEYKSFTDYKNAGINRVSMGAQSFTDSKLKSLGRVHNSADIYNAVNNLAKANITNFNLDLMYGLPQQSMNECLFDLQEAIKLNPTHISWYNLTIEPNTYFYKHRPKLPTEEHIYNMMLAGKNLLASNNYACYEVSAYSKGDSFKSQHNMNYWEFGDYIGIGAGAHGKISLPNAITRTWKTRSPNDYLNKENNFLAGKRILHNKDLAFEFMLNALRLELGFSLELFYKTTGLSFNDIQHQINLALDKELINFSNDIIVPTELGKKYLNDLCEIFLP